MSEYTLYCDEPHYVLSTYNEEMEQTEREIKSTDGLHPNDFYYWIESSSREDKLKVDNFLEAEKVMAELTENDKTFEEVAESEEFEAVTSIQGHRPPY